MTFPRPLPPSMLARVQAAPDVEAEGPVTPRMQMPPGAPTRHDVLAAERLLQAGAGQKNVERMSGAPVELIKGSTPAELAGPLAMKAMRLLERGMNDLNPRVAFEAARVAANVSPKVRELERGEVTDPDPEKRLAAVRAALASPDVVALVVEAASQEGTPCRAALERAGWRAPGVD